VRSALPANSGPPLVPSSPADPARGRHALPLQAALLWLAGLAIPVGLAGAGLILARSLHVEEFGKVAFFLSAFGLVLAYGSLGLTTRTLAAVARAVASRDLAQLAAYVGTTALMRVLSVLPLILAGVGLLLLGQAGLGAALIAGSLALTQDFVLAAMQGLGKPLQSMALQALHIATYATQVLVWSNQSSTEVFWAFGLSYLLPIALSTLLLYRQLIQLGVTPRVERAQLLPSAFRSMQVYCLGLLLSPLTTVGLLVLGWTQHFHESALFSAAMSFVVLLPQTFGVVVTALYFPRLCGLTSVGARGSAVGWFDTFWRAFGALALAGAAVLSVYPAAVIDLLYSGAYVSAAPLLVRLLPLVVLLPLNSLVLWSLVANQRAGWALAAALAQLALLLGQAAAMLLHTPPDLPFALADAHVSALVAGTAASLAALWRLHGYRPTLGRLILAGVAVIVLTQGFAQAIALPDPPASRMLVMGSLGAIATAASLALVFWAEMRALISRTAPLPSAN
jgi:hypothetical protein